MRIYITITGITELICNRFTEEAAAKATSGTGSSIATADRGTPLEIAESKLYKDAEGKLCIPQPNLLRCLIEGGRFHKAGKVQITTDKKSMLYGCVDIEGSTIELEHVQPWKVDTRPIRMPSGGRILTHRPMFDDWKLRFVMVIDLSIVTPSLMRRIVDDAGKRIGLGDFRPATKGPYGRFVVDYWQEYKDDEMPLAAE